jgi:hypothetical protein
LAKGTALKTINDIDVALYVKGADMDTTTWNERQIAVCKKYGVEPFPAQLEQKVGISSTVKEGLVPINAIRHLPVGDTTGWYIWAGEYSDDPAFFQPLHVKHLESWCPTVIPFLHLPPGWGVILAREYEDVWYDKKFLE